MATVYELCLWLLIFSLLTALWQRYGRRLLRYLAERQGKTKRPLVIPEQLLLSVMLLPLANSSSRWVSPAQLALPSLSAGTRPNSFTPSH